MRDAMIRAVTGLAARDETVEVLSGDLGFGIWDDFIRRFPGRFTNTGIAEQNMVSLAAGMARMGKTVFVYSIGNFPTLRCLEQIRNDCAVHGANVKIIGSGTGLTYGPLGVSHHAVEDVAALRAIPGLGIYCPSDPAETEAAVRELAARPGPCYLRIGRNGPALHDGPVESPLPGCLPLRAGGERADAAVLACGDIASEALEAAERLAREGIVLWVYSVPRLKPFAREAVLGFAGKTGLLATLEEHSVTGGLGSAAAEVLAEAPCGLRLLRFGLRDVFPEAVGSQGFLRGVYGLDAEHIAEEIRRAVRADPGTGRIGGTSEGRNYE